MRYAILFLFIITGILNAQETEINIKDLWENYSYYANQVPGFNFMNDGVSYSIQNGNAIEAYDLRTGNKIKDIFSKDGFVFSSYAFSKDEKMIVLETASEAIYRRSSRADYYVWNRDKEQLTQVSNEGKQRYATLNPAGDKIAYVRANDLFVKDLNDGKELRVTQDGAYNKIINGATDWVYEEEFAIAKAFQWSPDGQYLAFLRFDESNVKEFTYTTYEGALYPIYNTFKYPKAGEENAKVSVHIFNLDKNEKLNVKLTQMPDSYIPRIKWKNSNELCVTNINRHQNELNLFTVNARNGKTKLLFTEKNDCFVEIHDNLNFLEDGSFIWTSEIEGFNQIYLYNAKGKLIKKLTTGNYDVTRFYGYDPLNEKIYFQAAIDAAIQRGIYSVTLDGKLETIENRLGTCNAQFSSTYDYYVLNHSSADHPPTYEVYQTASRQTAIRAIEKNESLSDELAAMDLSKVEFIQLDHPKVEKLNAWMLKPKDFDLIVGEDRIICGFRCWLKMAMWLFPLIIGVQMQEERPLKSPPISIWVDMKQKIRYLLLKHFQNIHSSMKKGLVSLAGVLEATSLPIVLPKEVTYSRWQLQ